MTFNPCGCGNKMKEAKVYRKCATIRAVQMSQASIVRTIENELVKGEARDYLCENEAGYRWSALKDIFEQSYLLVENE